MPRNRLLLSLALVSALFLTSSTPARAAAVWTVLSIQVEGDSQAWLDLAKQVNVMRARLGVPAISIVQATFAGEATGAYFVSAEYSGLAALAEASAKVDADAGWPGLLKQLQASSKVASSSLYVDRTSAGVKSTAMTPGGYSSGIVVRIDGDPSAYFALLAKLSARFAQLGVPTSRVWQATLAGTNTGSILITSAYPSLAALEEGQKRIDGDAEAQQLIRDIEATGRKVVARLLVRDRTPR